MKIPFLDLAAQHRRIRGELDEAIRGVVDACAFIGGERLRRFEKALAAHMERRHARGVATGTAALTIALRALRLEPGDEVITTALSAVPTPEAITLAGARVVFADLEPGTFQIDPDQVASLITPRTRAILPVHLYGLSARIDRLLGIAERHELAVIEDVAQAQGARFQGQRLGSFGLAGCLSFFPSKNLGGFGDGGAVVTDDEDLARFVTMYRNHGRLEKFTHEFEGANERLDALQAAILEVKLRTLDAWNARRREVAQWYQEALAEVEEVALPQPIAGCEPVWHLYVVLVPHRETVAKELNERGVATGLHFPQALHMQPAYAYLGHGRGSFPVAEQVAAHCLSLPMDPFLTREQVGYVAAQLKAALGAG